MSAPARDNVVPLPVTNRARTDKEVLESSYREDFDVVWRVLARYGVHPNSLEDATQELFIRLHKALMTGAFDKSRSPRGWLIGAAWYVASELRKQASGRYEEFDGDEPRDHVDVRSVNPEQRFSEDDLVRRALAVLSDEERTLVTRYYIEEYTAGDLAELGGPGANTLYSRLRLAKKRFVDEMNRLLPQGAR